MEKKFSIGWLRGVDISSIVNEVIETISSLSVFVFVLLFLILFYFITFFFLEEKILQHKNTSQAKTN